MHACFNGYITCVQVYEICNQNSMSTSNQESKIQVPHMGSFVMQLGGQHTIGENAVHTPVVK